MAGRRIFDGEGGSTSKGCGGVTAGTEGNATLAGLEAALLGLFAMARRKRSRAG